jgi:excisionase family DNA binding protein
MAGVREKLLTASDLAALCEVDLKTIHNWVDRGRIAHFRTPGRHLRFRAADVADFLRAWGYSVPRELAKVGSRITLVVGSKDTLAQVSRSVGEGVPLRHAKHPYDALVFAGSDPPDIFIIDVRAITSDIDVNSMLEALHRALPQATLIALSDEPAGLPSFVTRLGKSDAAALKAQVAPAEPAAAAASSGVAAQPAQGQAEEAPRGLAVGERR